MLNYKAEYNGTDKTKKITIETECDTFVEERKEVYDEDRGWIWKLIGEDLVSQMSGYDSEVISVIEEYIDDCFTLVDNLEREM